MYYFYDIKGLNYLIKFILCKDVCVYKCMLLHFQILFLKKIAFH
jgi:hypothetical protein